MASVDVTLQQIYDMIKGGAAGVPVGTIVDYYGSSAPNGWLICDGRAVPDSMPQLKALIGANTPDLRGRFRRMIGGNAAGMAVAQGDAIRNIVGTVGIDAYAVYSGVFAKSGGSNGADGSYGGNIAVEFNASRVVPTANENRPVNMAFNTIIFGGGLRGLSFLRGGECYQWLMSA